LGVKSYNGRKKITPNVTENRTDVVAMTQSTFLYFYTIKVKWDHSQNKRLGWGVVAQRGQGYLTFLPGVGAKSIEGGGNALK